MAAQTWPTLLLSTKTSCSFLLTRGNASRNPSQRLLNKHEVSSLNCLPVTITTIFICITATVIPTTPSLPSPSSSSPPPLSLPLSSPSASYRHQYRHMTHWKRLWCWEALGAGGEGDDRGWDGWMASLTQCTWVWVNSGSWWWTGRSSMLQFMGRKESDRTKQLHFHFHTVFNFLITHFLGLAL